MVVGCIGICGMAVALERRISGEVNGLVEPEPDTPESLVPAGVTVPGPRESEG